MTEHEYGQRVECFIGGLTWSIRTGTTDWNTVNACAGEDEYGLRDEDVEGRLVFDIGAHVGGLGVWLASRGARVVFVEPVPSNIESIKINLALNGCTGTILEGAVGTNFVHLGPEGDAHEFIANIGGVIGAPRKIDCQEFTFSAIQDSFGVPDIVKIDCEGGEWACFGEMRNARLIVGEYHDDRIGGCRYTADDIPVLLPEHEVITGPDKNFGLFIARIP